MKSFYFYDEKFQGPVPKDGRVLENHCISVKENSGIKVGKKVLIVVRFQGKKLNFISYDLRE